MLKSILNSLVWWPLPTRLLNTALVIGGALRENADQGGGVAPIAQVVEGGSV